MLRSFFLLLAFALVALAGSPTVTIAHPQATIVGNPGEVESFNGIPFAQQPVGNLRLRPPKPLEMPQGTVDATGISKSCPQFWLTTDAHVFGGSNLAEDVANLVVDSTLDIAGELLTVLNPANNTGEDCLSLNIRRPAGVNPGSKLPVLVWIHGGGFEWGASNQYDGTSFLAQAMEMDQPFIFVAISYRLGGFGFLAGKEIRDDGASNLGLLDQRIALEWVADNIAAFGGDPEKVTIWGESAGAISVYDQMVLYDGNHTYKGKQLFRGAMMDSGSVIPTLPVDSPPAQAVYDAVVNHAGCDQAPDTLECLRALDYETFYNAANSVRNLFTYYSVKLSYLPRPDGKVLTDSPDVLVKSGRVAKVPFIIGDQEDEGTLFALFQPNITTTEDIEDYLAYVWQSASPEDIRQLVDSYPDNPVAGSPYHDGLLGLADNVYPQFKRMASILGDIVFTLQRRAFLHSMDALGVPSWTFISSYFDFIPILGTFHISDIVQVFYGAPPDYASSTFRAYYYSFIYDLDPNSSRGDLPEWPQWRKGQQALNMFSGYSRLIVDNFRKASYEILVNNLPTFRW